MVVSCLAVQHPGGSRVGNEDRDASRRLYVTCFAQEMDQPEKPDNSLLEKAAGLLQQKKCSEVVGCHTRWAMTVSAGGRYSQLLAARLCCLLWRPCAGMRSCLPEGLKDAEMTVEKSEVAPPVRHSSPERSRRQGRERGRTRRLRRVCTERNLYRCGETRRRRECPAGGSRRRR